MANANTVYAQKTKLREMIFLAYLDGQISHDSAISRIGVSNRQFIRLRNRFLTDRSLCHKLLNQSSNHSISSTIKATVLELLGDGRLLCLMHLVDDATKTSLAILGDAESTESAMQILFQWCLKYGVPQVIYCDRHSTYKVNEKQRATIEEELESDKVIRLSEFGKVCQRLGIKQIFANSPQAEGRVEHKHLLYKDRWVKELKLDGIKSIEEANLYLATEGGFIDKLNDKFTIEAREARPVCVLPTPTDLAEQFAILNTRTVRNDYTVQLHNVVYQLPRNTVVNARAKVVIKLYLDGSIVIFAGKNKLKYTIIDNYVKPNKPDKKQSVDKTQAPTKWTPPANHPFRQNYKSEKKYRQQSNSSQLQELGRIYGG